ncbi:MAG: hypothetical protein QOF16_985 [Actinomycetota bacterium]|nr:hypothetical protein [Actinomycetota bacterium]
MIALVRLELFKFRTTRMAMWFFTASLGLAAIGVLSTIASSSNLPLSDLHTEQGMRSLFTAGVPGAVVVILGIIGISGEYRNATITATLLATPQRWRVVVAKMIAYAIVGMAFAVGASAVTLAVALPALAIKGLPLLLSGLDLVKLLGRSFLASAFAGAYGVGIGATIKNQVVAIVVALLSGIPEAILANLLPKVGRFLPTNAATILSGRPAAFELALWVAILVELGYVVVLNTLGIWLTEHRDIT